MGVWDPTSWRTKFPHLQRCRCLGYLHLGNEGLPIDSASQSKKKRKRVLQPRLCKNLKTLTCIRLFKVHLPYFPQARLSLPLIPMLLSCKIFLGHGDIESANPSTTLMFTFPLLPRKEGFWILVTFNAFTNLWCTKASSMQGIKEPYGAPRPLLKDQ